MEQQRRYRLEAEVSVEESMITLNNDEPHTYSHCWPIVEPKADAAKEAGESGIAAALLDQLSQSLQNECHWSVMVPLPNAEKWRESQ